MSSAETERKAATQAKANIEPATYAKRCDGSAAVALDSGTFLVFGDENQDIGVYARGVNAGPLQTKNVSAGIGLSSSAEADIEDAARVGDRVYVVTSHGRDKKGKLKTSRYKFFAMDVTGAAPNLEISVAGTYDLLLQDLLHAANWVTPDASVIASIDGASDLSHETVADLAPKANGTNIEGLAALGDSGTLLIGFRNPHPGAAIVVTLLNADAVVAGGTAKFGQAITMNLDDQGIRSLTWSELHQSVFIVSGPSADEDGPFALWRWSGNPGDAPQKVTDLAVPDGPHPEAVVAYPGSTALQLVTDMGSSKVGGEECKDAPLAQQSFVDLVVDVF